MSIEDSMLMRGGKVLSDRILNFLNTIVVKNEQEADIGETSTSFNYYKTLEKCNYETSSFDDHTFKESDQDFPSDLRGLTNTQRDILVKEGKSVAVNYINILRKRFINNYIDKNPYYTALTGKPYNSSGSISIVNRDNPAFENVIVTDVARNKDGYEGLVDVYLSDITLKRFPNSFRYLTANSIKSLDNIGSIVVDLVELHTITFNLYPKTYTAVFVDGYINDIINTYGDKYPYVKYVGKNIDITNLRNTEHFDVLWIDKTILDDVEVENFYNAYYSIREFVLQHKYLKNLEELYDHYSNFELMIVIFGTYQRMCNLYIDRYSVRDYTDKEIYDILDSNNLENLKSVNIKILRNVVENIDTLVAHRGTEEVLKMIIDMVVKDQSLSIRRYDLVKKFGIDDSGRTKLDHTKPYDDAANVNLAFVDRTIHSLSNKLDVTQSDSQIIDYEDFVLQDKSWGANGLQTSDAGRREAVRKVKRDLLQMKFNRLSTKYIGITSVLHIFGINSRVLHKMGMIIQHYGGFKSLSDIAIQYKGISTNPLEMYNFTYYGYRLINKLKNNILDYDLISNRCCTYEKMMRCNVLSVDETLSILRDLKFKSFGRDYYVTIHDVLEDAEIKDIIISFDNSSGIFNNIMIQFDDNYDKFVTLGDKSTESAEYNVAMSWKTIYDWFSITIDSSSDYTTYGTSFKDYFETYNPNLYTLLENLTKAADEITLQIADTVTDPLLTEDNRNTILNSLQIDYNQCIIDIESLTRESLKSFKNSLNTIINEDESSDFDFSIKNSIDLNTLVTTFASIYVELRDIDINFNMSDDPNNRYQIMDRYYSYLESKISEQYILSYDFSIFEFCKCIENVIMRDAYEALEFVKNDDLIEFIDKYSIEHIGSIRSRFEFGELYSKELTELDREECIYTDTYVIEEL